MFTGIIEEKVKIKNIKKQNEILYVEFFLPKFKNHKISLGESVSINGICSTVAGLSKGFFKVGYMKETLDKTTVSGWNEGNFLNIERSLKVGDVLSGHFVYGHIDTVGVLKNIDIGGGSKVFEIQMPQKFMKYIVEKGSVAIDGVSLTISKKKKSSFEVSLIPYTIEHTNFGTLKKGSRVNIETDVLGKYILQSQK